MSGRLRALLVLLFALAATLLCGDLPGRAEETRAKKSPKSLSPEEAIRQALAKPVELKFIETPLADVAKHLEQTLGIQIGLDHAALDDVGIGADAPVTFQVSGISARSALERLLRDLELTWIVAHQMLLITTREEAECILETKVYDVADLVTDDFDCLIELITNCMKPTTWEEVGGPGSIAPFAAARITTLVVSQTRHVHKEVEALLADLRSVRREGPQSGEKPKQGGKPPSAKDQEPRSPEEAIRRALSRPIKLDFVETPLADVVDFLKNKAGIQIIVDYGGLEDVGIGTDTPVTIEVSGITLRSALDFMLRQLDLTWTIAHEVLLITTPEEAETMLQTKVYDVADLPAYRNQQGEGVPDYDSLIEMITACIQSTNWEMLGGPGSIARFEATGIHVLVVSQTREVHEETEALLAKLRKVRGEEPTEEDIAKLPPVPAHSGEPGSVLPAQPARVGGKGGLNRPPTFPEQDP